MERLTEVTGAELEFYQGKTYTRCSNEFPPIFFLFYNKWVEVASKDYVVDVSRNQDDSICLVKFVPTSSPFLIFGTPFFTDYITKFDDEKGLVTFLPAEGANKSFIKKGQAPTDPDKFI